MGRGEDGIFRARRAGSADRYHARLAVDHSGIDGRFIYVASATVDTLINAHERGADITMIGGLINGLGLSMIGGKQFKSYADLRGTTIGTQTLTSGTGFALRLV